MEMRVLLIVVITIVIHLTNAHFAKSRETLKQKQKRANVQRTQVLILGGGMAGVSAANTLQAGGVSDIVLIEATGRLGGRVHEANFFGYTIEEGANWIHGVERNNNPLLSLARAANVNYYVTTKTDTIKARDSTGRVVSKDVRKALSTVQKAEKQMYERADELSIDSDRLMQGALLASSLRNSSLKEALSTLGGWQARTPAEFTAEYFQFDFLEAKPLHEVSLVGNMNNKDEKYGVEEALVVEREGYSKIVRYVANQVFAPNDPRLRLNELVTEVHYMLDSDQDVPLGLPDSGVYVKTANGNEYWAQYCIITFSNAVLLSGNVKFQPQLPEWKAHALRQVETVVYDKIFVKFADNVQPFWDKGQWVLYVDSDPVAQASSATPYDIERSRSPAVQTALQRGDPYTRGYYTAWMNLTHANILPGSNMLVVVLVDQMAKAAERKSDAEIKSEITNVLRRMYGAGVPEPVGIHCTRWYSNPLALGSFHSIRIGATPADVANLLRGIRNLYFAGDGSDVAYDGLLQGAYITGQNKANVVLNGLRQQ